MDSMLLQELSTRPYLRLKIVGDEIVVYNVAGTWVARATTPYGMAVMIRDSEAKWGRSALAAEGPGDLVGLLREYLSSSTIEARVDGTVTLRVRRKVVWQLKHILHKIATNA
jgi:hypothetical protein